MATRKAKAKPAKKSPAKKRALDPREETPAEEMRREDLEDEDAGAIDDTDAGAIDPSRKEGEAMDDKQFVAYIAAVIYSRAGTGLPDALALAKNLIAMVDAEAEAADELEST
jgi:hypothetical protein